MKNNSNDLKHRIFIKERIIVSIICAFLFCGLSVCYALYYNELKLESKVGISVPSKGSALDLEVVDIRQIKEDNNYAVEPLISHTQEKTSTGINVNLNISASLGYKIWTKIEVTIVNNSNLYYTYAGSDSAFTFKNYSGEIVPLKYPIITGVIKGDHIAPGETKKVYISYFSSEVEEYGGVYQLEAKLLLIFKEGKVQIERPSILAAIKDTELEFDSNKNAQASFDVTSLFDSSQMIKFYLSNENLELLTTSGETTDYTKMIDKNSRENLVAAIHLKRGAKKSTLYETKIYGKILYEEEGKEETFEVGEVRVKNPDGEVLDGEVLKNVKITPTFLQEGWAEHSTGTITITNNNNFEITQWLIRINVNKEANVIDIGGGQHKTEINKDQNQIIIRSDNLYGVNHYAIKASDTLVVNNLYLNHTGVKEKPNTWTTIYYDVEVEDIRIDAYYEGSWHYGLRLE